MLQLLQSDIELVIDSGFMYLPLVYDPSVENEVGVPSSDWCPGCAAPCKPKPGLLQVQGRYYLKSVRIQSIIDNYKTIDPETYESLRRSVFNRFLRTLSPPGLSIDEKLRAIVFQIMPHFVRKKNRLHKRTIAHEEFLDLISREIKVPTRFLAEARRLTDVLSVQEKLKNIAGIQTPEIPNSSGIISAKSLGKLVLKALEAKIVEEEKVRIASLIQGREQFANLQEKYIALLLFIKETGSLELNGCGFFRNGSSTEYYVYVRTGEYALKDSYDRVYLFPDCRVGVSTNGPLVPYVLDKYKHPFLKGFEKMQKICVRGDFVPAWKFNASGAIHALEEGINALFHGYNSQRGNGYHRLDNMRFEKTSIVFEEFRVLRDDPKIVTGEVEIKNDFY